jgi:hypothetical protein
MNTQQTLTGLEFSVAIGHGTVPDKIVIDSDQVLIGSGPHCEIRLPPDQAASEHIQITNRGGAIYALARAAQPPALLDGVPFTEAPLMQGARLSVGPTEITVSLIEVAEGPKIEEKKSEKISPLTLALAAIVAPVCVFILLDDPNAGALEPKPKEVPGLWEGDGAKCSHSAKEQAQAVARDRRILALGRRERSPFDVRDGVLAVPLFEMSADCYRVAGEKAVADDMAAAGSKLKSEMEETYRAHQMRLEHSLDVRNLRLARRETQVLLRMLEGRTGPYVEWLSNLERQIKLKLGKDSKKKKKKKK